MKKRIVALLVAGACQNVYAASDLPRLAWTDDPSSTITIGWRQLSGVDARVEFGTTEDKNDWSTHNADRTAVMQHPDDTAGLTLDTTFAEVKGLSPDTAYYFQICDSEGCSETSWFKTAPNNASDFTFVAGGDSRTNQAPRQDGNKLVSKIRPLFVLFNGDYTDNGTHDEWVTWLQDWQLSRSEDGRVYPIVAIHGNHENDVVDMTRDLFGIPATGYYTLNVGGEMMEIFALNSETEPGVGYGAYSSQTSTHWDNQTTQFAADAASSTASWKVGTYHRPMRPHTSGKSEGTGRIEAWATTFTDNNFDLLIESDTHMTKYTFPVVLSSEEGSYQDFKRDDANGMMIIGEGSWGAPTRPTDDDKPWTMDSASFWQFKLVHASSDNMRIRTVRFGSESEAEAGVTIDTDSVTALTQADQDANAFAIPAGLPLWSPLSGSYIDLPKNGFAGADIDNLQLVGSGANWKYLDDGSSPANWTTAEFDDSTWAQGNAQLGYGDGDETTVLSFGEDSNNKHTTTYFRKNFNLAESAEVIKLTLRLLRDDGAVVYINGQEAIRSNMPSGDITSSTFAGSGIGGAAESTYYEYALFPELLQTGVNTIAVEVHQADLSSSDLSFDMDLTAVVSNVNTVVPETTTELTVTPLSIQDIQLDWSDDAAFDEVGYQIERKVVNGAWEILTWRVEADTTQYIDSKLNEGEEYSYRVRPYSAAGLAAVSNETTTATLSNPVPSVYLEDFSAETLDNMLAISQASDSNWEVRSYNNNFYAYMNGYGADTASEDWLITPALEIGYYSDTTLSFETAYKYSGPLLGVMYSTEFAPSTADVNSASWVDIPACSDSGPTLCWTPPETSDYTFAPSELDMSLIDAETIYIAFKYTSTGTGGGDGSGWQVDNINLRGNYVGSTIEGSDLSNGVPSNWTNHSVASDANWEAGTKLDQTGAFINGYGADAASEDWMIFPSVTLAADDLASLRFDYYQKYDGPMLKIMVSTDYTDGEAPSTATWTDLGVQFPDLHDAWMSMGPISLAGYEGSVHVAFVYESTGTGGGDGASIGIANAEIQRNIEGVVQENTVTEEVFGATDNLGTFTSFSRSSNADWTIETRADEQGAVISGFGADAASDDWLITPELSILNWQNAKITFDVYTKYGGPALEVMISNNYSGSGDPMADGVNWSTLDFDMSDAVEDDWTNYTLDVAQYTGTAYVAFRYSSTGTGSGDGRRLGVDNFKQISTFGEAGMSISFSLADTTYTTIEEVNFSVAVSDGVAPYTYSWSFGDGTTSTEQAPTHTYTEAGNYTVSVTVTDSDSNVKTVTRENYITVQQATAYEVPAKLGDLRIATFNAYLNRSAYGEILTDAQSGSDKQIQNVAEIIQRVRPEVLLLQEFDYIADGSAVEALIDNYLNVSQNEQDPIDYPHVYLAESNTGILTAFDLDNDGDSGDGGGDSYGFGDFEGQYAMVLLSQYPILVDEVRTFQKFLWKDMPNAMLPVDPVTGESWYSDEELDIFRLSSKSHWDVPINVNGTTVHVLASHPTPPVFDGDEDRNGRRNHDEVRFWADYVDQSKSSYIYDDNGETGGLAANSRFVIMGDLNASSVEGDATSDPIGELADSIYIDSTVAPVSIGGEENDSANEHAPSHTADWKMRADYVLPSIYGITVEQTAVYWPSSADKYYYLVGPGVQSSDHRLVYLDSTFTTMGEPVAPPAAPISPPADAVETVDQANANEAITLMLDLTNLNGFQLYVGDVARLDVTPMGTVATRSTQSANSVVLTKEIIEQGWVELSTTITSSGDYELQKVIEGAKANYRSDATSLTVAPTSNSGDNDDSDGLLGAASHWFIFMVALVGFVRRYRLYKSV